MAEKIRFFCRGLLLMMSLWVSCAADAQTAQVNPPAGGKTYLLAVGINEYVYLPRMKSCVNNAALTAQAFRDNVLDIEVTLLTDRQATKSSLQNALDGYKKRLTANDRLIFYYSGHGGKNTMYWSSRSSAPSRYHWRDDNIYDESIMPADASYNKDTHFTPDELSGIFKALPSRNILIIVDCSYNYNANVPGVLPSFSSVSQIPRPRYSLRDFNMYGMTVINSSDWKEAAIEKTFNGKALGVFTYYLAQGITTRAAGTEHLSVNNIFEYARMFTMQEVGVQHPQIYRGRNRDIVLVRSVPE